MNDNSKNPSRLKNWLELHPFFLLSLIGKSGFALIQIATVLLCLHPIAPLSESTRLQILSTGIQVIAGLYGLTLTGYIFFLDHLGQKAAKDPMLADVVEQIKRRFYRIILIITVNCLLAFLGGSIMLLCGNLQIPSVPPFFPRLLFGETLIFLFSSIVMILAFVISVVDPQLEKKISVNAREQMESSGDKHGNLNTFLSDYQEIEQILRKKCQEHSLDHIVHGAKITLGNMGDLLKAKRSLNSSLWQKINRLSLYYSFTVFSKRDFVSDDICCLAKEILKELRKEN